MTMHPELERALNDNVSALEMIKAFTKYHCGVIEGHIEVPPVWESIRLRHHDSSFWDIWQPLFRNVYPYHDPSTVGPASEPFLSIHRALTKDIISWLCDSNRRSNVYLITEAQTQTENVNENYRANAFATICHDARRFGLPLRGAHSYTPINSICSTLAAYYPTFRRLLTRALIDNPKIHQQPTRVRFKTLIHEPWKTLQESSPEFTAAPPVIVLRFLDMHFLEDEELLPLVCEFSSSQHASSLLWIVSFNPKFKHPVPDFLDPFSFPRLSRLPIDYDEARADTELFLRHRFSILRRKHKEMFDEHEVWPAEEQMSHLTRIFSGVFDSIDVVDQFVDWEGGGGPKTHLETFLAYMVDSPSPSDEHPYCAVDHFYTRVSSDIAANLLPVINQVLNSVCCKPGFFSALFTSFQLACFLSVEQDTIHSALLPLCRWAVVSFIWEETVFYKVTPFFQGFLEDSGRSGRFCMPKSESGIRTYQASLRIASLSPNLIESMKPVGPFSPIPHVAEAERVLRYARMMLCYVLDAGTINPSYINRILLRHFDFRCLAHSGYEPRPHFFFSFLKRLHAWDKSCPTNIVRVEPLGPLDRLFIDKCAGVAEPLDLQEKGGWFDLHPAGPKYVLLGLEAGTVLVLLSTRKDQEEGSVYHGYNAYTSAMLDDM